MFSTTRLSAVLLFRMCDIAMLRSMQIQDPDNRVSVPTDLVVKPDFNRFRIILGIVLKCWRAEIWRISAPRTQNSQIFSWWNDHRSEHRNRHRTRPGICGLVHNPFFYSKFELNLRNSAKLCGLLSAAHVPPLFPGFAHCTLGRPGDWIFRNTKCFIKI